jgi:hypothetical protein
VLKQGKIEENSAMKIDNHDQIVKTLKPEETTRSQPAGDREFGKILNETIEETPRSDAGHRQTVFVNPFTGVRLSPQESPDPNFTIGRIESMIDLLESYRQELADPQVNLKQMDAIIQNISRENDSLASLADSMPDDEIKHILNHTMVTASLEVTKFYRGDYLPV